MVMNWWFHFRICQHVHGPSSLSSTSNRRGLRAHAAGGRQHVSTTSGPPTIYLLDILCKSQIVVKNLRIVAQWWTSSEGHLLRLYFGVFQPSVVSSNMLNAVAQRPYEHSLWQCLRGYQGFHVTWIMVMNIHISTTGSSTSTCDRRAVEQPVCEDDKIYVQHQLCVSGRQALCASRWLMTGLHCGTIVHIIGDEQRTYLVVKGTDRNRALRLSRANGWHGDSEILMLCNSRISVLIRIKEELHSTRL